MAVPADDSAPQIYEICSAGPVMIFYTEDKSLATVNRSENETENSLAFQIYHGWQPLFMSTAHCFSKIICQSKPPVIISGCMEVHLQGVNILVYMLAPCKIFKYKKNKKIEVKKVDGCEVPSEGVVDIVSCKKNKFGDTVKACITDNMTVYCQGGQQISYTANSEATIFRVKKNKNKKK